ncbi:MAG: DNA polymerase III subunit gamma/tau [Hyphomicrobiaceae bacterium]|nr:DNA polymerase III subunit gamma/tau [Hyphomicrobiaceae bacterium]
MARRETSKTTGSDGGAGDNPDHATPYVVLARKYRPASFEDLIGQSAMVTTLRNAFASGRIAQGYMLTGVRGVGKTTTARILARGLNYEPNGPTTEMPVLGPHCPEIMESRHPDVVEMDAASNTGVDNIREIIESARYRPMIARYKVFIIDEVHMLSKGAFNALLKTLEEPPEHVKFIFATTEIRKVPVTVLSRCQRFDLRRVDVPDLVAHFKRIATNEGAQADEDALALIARAAGGSVRDGLSILDQAIAMGQGHVTEAGVRDMLGLADRGRVFDLLELVFAGKAGPALESFAGLLRDGADAGQLMADLAEAVHIATRVRAVGGGAAFEGLSAEERRRAGALADRLSVPLLSRAWQMLLKGYDEVSRAPNAAAAAEMVLIRICYSADLPSPDEIIRILGGGAPTRRSLGARDAASRDTRGEARAIMRDAPVRAEETSEPRPRAPAASPPHVAANGEESDDSDGYERFADDAGPNDESDFFEDAVATEASAAGYANPLSFAEVVALAGSHREVLLKTHLEERVSLVRFDHATGAIDLHLLAGAPPGIANELRERLNQWTGRRWMVMLSKAPGDPTLADVRRRKLAEEIAQLSAHPAVRVVLDAFPDARIDDIRPIETDRDDDSATG